MTPIHGEIESDGASVVKAVFGLCDIIYLAMFFLREIYSHLRAGFRSETSFLMACILLGVLDLGAVVGMIWYFFFRWDVPINPSILMAVSSLYLLCAWMVAMLATRFSRLLSVRAVALFYISVGLFFLLFGFMDLGGRMIAVWPWAVMWVVTLAVVLANLGREFDTGRPNQPPL